MKTAHFYARILSETCSYFAGEKYVSKKKNWRTGEHAFMCNTHPP